MTSVEQPSASFRPSAPLGGFASSNAGHLPFVSDLLASCPPSLIVSLGVAYGDFYFGVCQLVSEYGYDCPTYGIDTWPNLPKRKNPNVGTQNPAIPNSSNKPLNGSSASVFDLVSRHNNSHFRAFSKLVRSSFDEALSLFQDKSISILVIDSLQSYEALRQMFDSWLMKTAPGGLILLNHISVNNAENGASRLWKDIKTGFKSFSFLHSSGLGIIANTAEEEARNGFLDGIFQSSPEEQERLRRYYSLCVERFEQGTKAESVSSRRTMKSEFQVFHSRNSRYDSAPELAHLLPSNTWVNLGFELPDGTGDRPLRLHVSSVPAVVDIATLSLRKEDGHTVWSWNPKEATEQLRVAGTAIRMHEPEFFRVLAVGDSPHVFLPEFAGATFQQPLELEIRLRVDLDLAAVKEIATKTPDSAAAIASSAESMVSRTKADSAKYLAQSRIEHESKLRQIAADADARVAASRTELEALRMAFDSARTEHQHVAAKYSAQLAEERRSHQVTSLERENLAGQQSRMLQEVSIAQGNVEELKAEVERLSGELANIEFDLTETRKLNARLASSLEEERNIRVHMQESGSWQLTKPLRAVGGLFGPRKRY